MRKLYEAKSTWRLYSKRVDDELHLVDTLVRCDAPGKTALISADGNWAEVYDDKNVLQRVLVRCGPDRRKVE